MIYLIIGLLIVVVILVLLYIREIRIRKDIARQLKFIMEHDTNQLLHSDAKGETALMVNNINKLLSNKRKDSIFYQRKSHTIDQMITNISHDIRTPLTSALGYINIIRNQNVDEQEKERELEIVEKRLHRMEELIEQFFEFSKVISRDEEIKKEEINIVAGIEESCVHFYDDYVERSRKIVLDTSKRKIIYESNRGMLLRVFDNIINNALKHGSDDLKIELKYLCACICLCFYTHAKIYIGGTCMREMNVCLRKKRKATECMVEI